MDFKHHMTKSPVSIQFYLSKAKKKVSDLTHMRRGKASGVVQQSIWAEAWKTGRYLHCRLEDERLHRKRTGGFNATLLGSDKNVLKNKKRRSFIQCCTVYDTNTNWMSGTRQDGGCTLLIVHFMAEKGKRPFKPPKKTIRRQGEQNRTRALNRGGAKGSEPRWRVVRPRGLIPSTENHNPTPLQLHYWSSCENINMQGELTSTGLLFTSFPIVSMGIYYFTKRQTQRYSIGWTNSGYYLHTQHSFPFSKQIFFSLSVLLPNCATEKCSRTISFFFF